MFKDFVILVLALSSCFFFLVGTTGLIRLPDVFSRMHATTKSDTLGAGLALLALIVYKGVDPVSLKLLVVLVFIMVTNPVAAHIISKAAYDKEIGKRKEGPDADI
ncbi:monovalent cation/H(+) antiporter subunit G [Proteiniclasticum sp. SCR006]|uniref:Monovalent cation/H(+) antiporter subunit G n=1 Tax=Proteiniclasticum aestuarii TaxID=2817862 RepID=A0A939H7L0_9CLOT|nr:monovalent cation/H(+) antiporter subunit G [Proteiniclasticum aestuarii]MBO1263478.1 monovalent cation/H(+) antiporter subunit G [Proteiniclasticum aestuarii]